jgi:hypothetical protein
MAQPIPEPWRTRVIAALKTADDKVIGWTPPALQRWKDDTFGAWKFEAYEAIISALSTPDVTGNETSPLQGQKAAYEFLFTYRPQNGGARKTMYGKIALKGDGVRILILSAHVAERSRL